MVTSKRSLGWGVWFAVAAMSVLACGDSESSTSSSTSTYCCGINKAYFDCPNADAFKACGSGDSSGCTSRKDPCN